MYFLKPRSQKALLFGDVRKCKKNIVFLYTPHATDLYYYENFVFVIIKIEILTV